jgi:hypothetical protein
MTELIPAQESGETGGAGETAWTRLSTPVAATAAGTPDHRGRRVAGWSMLLAPGWWHVRLDEHRHRSVHQLFDRLLASLPRDQVFAARHELETEIGRVVDQAADAGGVELYLLVSPRYGVPLAASCIATVLDFEMPREVPAAELARLLTDGPDDEAGVLTVDGVESVRIRRATVTPSLPTGEDGEPVLPEQLSLAEAAAVLPDTRLEVQVRFPDGGRTLLLTFSTPLPPVLADAMVELFEAMAESVRWRSE